MTTVVGFTKKQREWILRRDGHQCCAYHKNDGKWIRCGNTTDLQIHHILPRSWSENNMPKTFPVNGSTNGITLCAGCHIGKFVDIDDPLMQLYIIHIDTEEARLSYAQGNKHAYEEMCEIRARLIKQGIPYWNTRFDWMFKRWALRKTAQYTRKHPEDKYPTNRRRGLNGRE